MFYVVLNQKFLPKKVIKIKQYHILQRIKMLEIFQKKITVLTGDILFKSVFFKKSKYLEVDDMIFDNMTTLAHSLYFNLSIYFSR